MSQTTPSQTTPSGGSVNSAVTVAVSGGASDSTASGTVAPDLEIDVKFECAGAKAILKLASAASWPPARDRRAERRSRVAT